MKIRTVIIDDEQGAREALRKMIGLYCLNVEIIAEAQGVDEGLQVIKNTNPDLILLDIKMFDGTGFDLLKRIENADFKIIFITAYDEFALNAIKFSALDYLLKPAEPEELAAAIKKAELAIEVDILNLKIKTLIHNIEKENKRLTVKTSECYHIISVNEIIRCEAEGNYTRFFLQNGNKILVSTTLKEYEELLEQYQFFRTHQSHLINLKEISRFEKKDGGTIIMKDKSKVPVSTRKKERLLEVIENL
ncbi:MAG TPA: LytTR family DNA-binding domain-containing protein [Cytophagales bacterium]|nr:LytTR family DNA-binding domain-containing protein [Cytophagales bacterium]